MWQLSETTATWQESGFHGLLDLRHPERGLEKMALLGQSLDTASLLQVHWGPTASRNNLQLEDYYARGNDLVGSYANRPAGVHPQFRWRAAAIKPHVGTGAMMIDMLISIHTDRLDATPTTRVQCRLPARACEVWRDPAETEPTELSPTEERPEMAIDYGGTGCVLTFPLEQTSYCCGLIFPAADVVDTHLSSVPREGILTSTISFFGGRLEKGTMRRTQLRLIMTPQDAAKRVLKEQWTDMMQSPPPLTN